MSGLTRADLSLGDRLIEFAPDSETVWVVEDWGLRDVTSGEDDRDWVAIEANGGLGLSFMIKMTSTNQRLSTLRPGEEFSLDGGQTWHTANAFCLVRTAKRV